MNGIERGVANVKVGDRVEVTIEGKGAKGDPICHIANMVTFIKSPEVPLAVGETVTVEITAITSNCGFAKVAQDEDDENK